MCETAFSAMTVIKTKQRNRLDQANNAIRVALSKIQSRIDSLAAKQMYVQNDSALQ